MDTKRIKKYLRTFTHSERKSVVCIGGGTGTFVTLSGLKAFPLNLSAVVTMSDSGGSNKRIRDEFGLLPTSDIRQCLIALSAENGKSGLLRKLFMYRFEKGEGISGMTFGNLFMAALTDIVGSQEEAIKQTSKVLRINGSVIPVSFTDTNLFATYENGVTVSEEHLIDEPKHDGTLHITKLSLKPRATANPQAVEALKNADLIVLGPGDLYTSLLPNIVVDNIADAIKNSSAKKVYVMNLMTKFGQTYNFSAKDHIKTLEKYIGKSIDYVLVNTSEYPGDVLKKYKDMKEFPVVDDLPEKAYYKVIREPFVSSALVAKSSSDTLVRSLIRHDSDKLAAQLAKLV
ncbi:MAG TPA: gluconeogenesis factor YvcK family protein [Candidatus Eisenbacteria bacterium]|nr:gluconeogenesis factor YvcK family protein [Candidatus Eisenbacteria bacterium]